MRLFPNVHELHESHDSPLHIYTYTQNIVHAWRVNSMHLMQVMHVFGLTLGCPLCGSFLFIC